MNIFIILNIIKLIVGVIIIYLTCDYISISKDFVVWVLSMGVGGFILLWSVAFFLLLGIMKLFSKENLNKLALKAYKYTGLLASFVLTNFFLMSFDFWNKGIAIIILIAFIILSLII